MERRIILNGLMLLTCIVGFLFISCQSINEFKSTKSLKTDTKDISVLFYGKVFPWTIEESTIPFSYEVEFNEVGFATKKDTIRFILTPKDSIAVNFVFPNDTITAYVKMYPKPAEFDANYINNNKGTYKVLSPEVHELVNICLSLTKVANKESNMINMETQYYANIITRFGVFSNHPLIEELNKNLKDINENEAISYYYNVRMNACMYTFDNEKIVNISNYNRLGFESYNSLEKLIPMLEDFAKKSNFREFYLENEPYYKSLIGEYYNLVPINTMWEWIEAKFPQKYQSYKIYFSPLIAGMHATQRFSDNEFNETMMFVNAPVFSEDYSKEQKKAILARKVFTEIDHNYVNPTTDKFNEIKALLQPVEEWNSGNKWYGDSYATFNEYMTWAIFSLYLYDNFDEAVFKDRIEIETDFMINKRGFLKFKEFNEFVIDWYKKNPDSSINNLYKNVIQWIKNN